MSNRLDNHGHSRRTFLKFAAGTAGLALAACVPAAPSGAPGAPGAASPAQETVTVLWWRSQGGAIGDMLDQFAEDFSEMDNGITIQAEYQGGYVEHMNKIIASAAANALPDMTLLGDGQYPPLARNNILLSLDDLIDSSESFSYADYKEPIYRGILEDGHMYQLAYGVSTPIYYVNREALDAAGLEGVPDTWDQAFEEYFPALANADMTSFAYSPGNWWQQSAVWSAGAMVEDDNWEIDLAHPAVIEWFERMQQARQNGEAHVPTQADGGASAYFGSGRAAMTIESTGLIGQVDSISEGSFTAEVGFLPSGPGGRWVPSGGNGLSIMHNVDGDVRDAAWSFIEYLHSPEPYAAYVELTGYIPISTAVEELLADLMVADPRRQVAVDQFEFSRWHMKIHTVARASQEMKDAWDECIETDVNVAERLQRLQDTVVEIAREEGFEPTLPM